MSLQLFTLDSGPFVKQIGQVEEQQKLAQEYLPESINKIKKWVQKKEFLNNPIHFLHNWKLEHPKEVLLEYERFRKVSGAWPKESSAKGKAYLYLAKIIMGDDQFIPTFISWVKANAAQLVQQLHHQTDVETCEKVKTVFLATVSSDEFYKDLCNFRDFVVGKKYPANVDAFGSLSYVLRFPLIGEECPDIIGQNARHDVKKIIWNYFDFTHLRN